MKKELWPAMKQPHPGLEGLPDALKDPECFNRVEAAIERAGMTAHKHRKPSEWIKCPSCQKKREARQEKIKEFGFKDYAQYLLWRQIMDIIKNRKDIWLPPTKGKKQK